MQTVKAEGIWWSRDSKGEMLCIRYPGAQGLLSTLDEGKEYDIDIKPHSKRRSLDANSYMWVLLGKMGEKLRIPKELLYREYIREIGAFTPLPIKECAVEDFRRIWESHGTGWVCDVVDDSKLAGYKLVHAYSGSSTYDTAQMSRLIDMVVQDAKEQGIETMTPQQLAGLVERWGA